MTLSGEAAQGVLASSECIYERAAVEAALDRIGDEINAALPTLQYLLDHGASLILCSHLGRPKSPADTQFSMGPVAARLSDNPADLLPLDD